jgi:hypothetical protein
MRRRPFSTQAGVLILRLGVSQLTTHWGGLGYMTSPLLGTPSAGKARDLSRVEYVV